MKGLLSVTATSSSSWCILLQVPPVAWEGCPSSAPFLLPECSSPHSQRACQRADSAIIQLLPLLLGWTLGLKCRRQRDAGRCALADTCNNTLGKKTNYITHTHFPPSLFYTKSLCFNSHTHTDKSPAAKPWQWARTLICMGQSWYLDGGLLGRPTQISLTPRLTHSGLVFFWRFFCSPSNL